MRAIAQFFILLQGFAVLLAIGIALSMWKSIFGQYSGEAFWIIFGGLIVLGLILNLRAAQRAKKNARSIIHIARNVNTGHFTRWFDRQNEWPHSDDIPLRRAPAIVQKVYGGIDTVALLMKEGFGQMVRDDVMEVFGFERGAMVFSQLKSNAAPVQFRFSLLGFLAGYRIGHDIVRR